MKKILHYSMRILISLVVILVITEFSLRLMGYKPAEEKKRILKSILPVPFASVNPITGFLLNSGRHTFLFENGFSFTVSNDSSGFRKTSYDKPKEMPAINFYGCSIFYGYGLPDSSVFCWKLNKKIKEYQVNNYAIFAHGFVTPLLLLDHQIKNGRKPEVAVVSYASFYLERNIYSLDFQTKFRGQEILMSSTNFQYPYVRLEKNNSELKVRYSKFESGGFPLATLSVLSKKLEETYINLENKFCKPALVDSLLIEKYIDQCKKNNIELVFAFITKDAYSTAVYKRLRRRGIHCADLFVDYNDPKLNLMPYDVHPNALAHTLYAIKMENYLRKTQLIPHL